MAITQVITQLPTPPDPATDSSAQFATKAQAFTVALAASGSELNAFTTQANALETNVNAKEVSAVASATTATTQAGLATTNGNAQVVLATDQVVLATAQAVIATTGASTATTKASESATSASNAELSRIAASKLNLGNKSNAPTVDNQGQALLAGATYYDTALNKWRVWSGIEWAEGISAVAGVSSVNGLTGAVTLASTSIAGTTAIYVSQVIAYTITDFDAFSTYAVAVSAGSVTRTLDAISFTAPVTAGNVTLTVTTNGVARAITLTVQAAGVATPSITSPTNAATGVTGPAITLMSGAFVALGVADTHLNSDWQLATDAGFTTILQSTSADAASKTSWSTTVAVSTTYYARVRHRGTANGVSAYSATVVFTTAAAFNNFIATPTATPAIGAAFEGGFYTGMIWNELVQSSTSTVIGTGSKVFTVPSMSSAPIAYAGQTLEVRSRANPANKMIGTVTDAIGTSLTINVASVGGSGTFTDWSIMSKYRIIKAPKSIGESSSKTYKNANTAAPAACGTLTEGYKATLAMVAAADATVYPAAWFCRSVTSGGFSDFYLGARDENELNWRNLKPTTDANYTAADRGTTATPDYKNLGSYGDVANTHGLNNNSSPTGAAYTSGSPSQTSVAAFQTSGSEAFAYGSFYYWSSTEFSATGAWLQYWFSSSPGSQSGNNKTNAFYVRAVRRSII
jgi:hypothetical protein